MLSHERMYGDNMNSNIDLALNMIESFCCSLGNKHADAQPNKRLRKKMPEILRDIKIAAIMDLLSWHCFRYECKLLQLRPHLAVKMLEAFKPDLLFVESAWHGFKNEWEGKIAFGLSSELVELVEWCKHNNVPALFWNKEDPDNFNIFIKSAQIFDMIFTTDIDSIPRYKHVLGHDRIYVLPFAAQPRLHNPIEEFKRENAVCFAGSYYKRYIERSMDFDNYCDKLAKFLSVRIYDRYYNQQNKNFEFPERFKGFILGSLSPKDINKAYKGYNFGLNITTCKNSNSMFARRVFELIASNTTVISNYSIGIKNFFGDVVFQSPNAFDACARMLSMSHINLAKLRLVALRKVMLEHTYARRLEYILEKAFAFQAPSAVPSIAVVAQIKNQADVDNVMASFVRQSHPAKKLTLLMPENSNIELSDKYTGENITILNNAEWLSYLESLPHNESIACFHPSDWYGANYLLDLSLAEIWSTADAFGKAEYYAIDANGQPCLYGIGNSYGKDHFFAFRRGMIKAGVLKNLPACANPEALSLQGQAVDAFNYCEAGNRTGNLVTIVCGDLQDVNAGLPVRKLHKKAEGMLAIAPDFKISSEISGAILAGFCLGASPLIAISLDESGIICGYSALGRNEQAKAVSYNRSIYEIPQSKGVYSFLAASGAPVITYELRYRDAAKKFISATYLRGGGFHELEIPTGAKYYDLCIKIKGGGDFVINALYFGFIHNFQQTCLFECEK